MNCKEFEKHIMAFITDDDIDDELAEEFERHFMSCDKCWDNFHAQLDAMEIIREKGVEGIIGRKIEVDPFDEQMELGQACLEVKDYEYALKHFSKALELRPDDQEIKDLLKKAKTEHSELLSVKLIQEGVDKKIKLTDRFILPISKAGKVIIELAGKVLLDTVLRTDDFRGVVATATDYNEDGRREIQPEVLIEKDGVRIEIERGVTDGKLIISKADE